MSTRSYIGKDYGDEIKAIYCHFDGYPSGVGATLKEFYSDDTKIDELIRLGDISSLGKQIDIREEFKNKKIDVSKTLNKKATFFALIENGTLNWGLLDENGKPIKMPYDETPKSSYKIFDLPYMIRTIKEECILITNNNSEVSDYWDNLEKEIRDTTTAYCRDRGKSLSILSFSNEKEYAMENGVSYVYLWKNGEWNILDNEDEEKGVFKPLRV